MDHLHPHIIISSSPHPFLCMQRANYPDLAHQYGLVGDHAYTILQVYPCIHTHSCTHAPPQAPDFLGNGELFVRFIGVVTNPHPILHPVAAQMEQIAGVGRLVKLRNPWAKTVLNGMRYSAIHAHTLISSLARFHPGRATPRLTHHHPPPYPLQARCSPGSTSAACAGSDSSPSVRTVSGHILSNHIIHHPHLCFCLPACVTHISLATEGGKLPLFDPNIEPDDVVLVRAVEG